jgi:sodium pump decarboxylase gamma subunit
MTAILGILIVFTFLALLSFLMFAIKEIFGEKPIHESAPDEAKTVDAKTAAEQERAALSRSTQGWVIAAATVFLTEEALEARRSAASWKPSAEEKSDPWVAFPRI